jgi:hypothetical protein
LVVVIGPSVMPLNVPGVLLSFVPNGKSFF